MWWEVKGPAWNQGSKKEDDSRSFDGTEWNNDGIHGRALRGETKPWRLNGAEIDDDSGGDDGETVAIAADERSWLLRGYRHYILVVYMMAERHSLRRVKRTCAPDKGISEILLKSPVNLVAHVFDRRIGSDNESVFKVWLFSFSVGVLVAHALRMVRKHR